jgi:hypothetical protein
MAFHRRHVLAAVSVVAMMATYVPRAEAAVVVTRAELNSGQLRLEGGGALPNHLITVNPGNLTGTSDGNGAFKIQSSPYSSTTCQITVSDGTTSASTTFSGCTPSQPAPSAPAVTLTPSSLTFPTQSVGTTSTPQTISVTNSGGSGLFINSAQTRGSNALDFTQVSDGCSGTTVGAGSSCSVSITFSPTAAGARSATFIVTDNASNSPQSAPVTGVGAGETAPVSIDTRFFTCSNGVCDIGSGSNVFVNNFFTTTFLASGGTAPYTWSGQMPSGLTLRPTGLLLGAPATIGTSTFQVTVTDANGGTATGTFALTVTGPPSPTPSGCQTGGTKKEALSGSAFSGKTPRGQATADMTQFSGCGGFSTLSVSVSNVNLPDGAVLWVTLDFKAVGTIMLQRGSGTMPTYNMGFFGVSRDQVAVYSALPDVASSQRILIGGQFL